MGDMMDYYTKIRQLARGEKIILAGAAGAVVKDGKILLARRHNLSRNWGVPGGVQEFSLVPTLRVGTPLGRSASCDDV